MLPQAQCLPLGSLPPPHLLPLALPLQRIRPASLVTSQRGSHRASLTVSADSFLVMSRMFHGCYAGLLEPAPAQHAKALRALPG